MRKYMRIVLKVCRGHIIRPGLTLGSYDSFLRPAPASMSRATTIWPTIDQLIAFSHIMKL